MLYSFTGNGLIYMNKWLNLDIKLYSLPQINTIKFEKAVKEILDTPISSSYREKGGFIRE